MFCQKCGTNIPEGDRFCPTCGEPVAFAKAIPETDHSAMFEASDIERTKILSAICYVSFVFAIVGLLAEPNSKFLRYHINQVIMLNVLAILCVFVAIIPFIGWIVSFVGSIAILVFTIMGIVNALNGRAKDLPLCGKYTVIHYD